MVNMTPTTIKAMLAAAIMLILCSACGPVVKNPVPLASLPTPPPVLEQEYRIQVGDEMDIKFFYNSELNEHLSVRPDGRISLQLIEEVVALGLTPAELSRLLKAKYADQLTHPEVTVIVKTYNKYKVFVDGEVNTPGVRDLVGTTTLRQCIAMSGGLKDTARANEIVVIRQRPNDKPMVATVNLERINDGTDFSQDITLMSYDIVYVPKSPIANVNKWLEQYIQSITPLVPLGFLAL